MATEPEPTPSQPSGKRLTWKKNGPTKRVEVQTLGPKAGKAAAAEATGVTPTTRLASAPKPHNRPGNAGMRPDCGALSGTGEGELEDVLFDIQTVNGVDVAK